MVKAGEDEVVISGIGGCFPKSKNLNEFKENLYKNESLLQPMWTKGI